MNIMLIAANPVMLMKSVLIDDKRVTPGEGWVSSLAMALLKVNDVDLSLCYPCDSDNELISDQIENLTYYTIPHLKNFQKYTRRHLEFFKKILEDAKPDVITVFGTESTFRCSIVDMCEELNYLDRVIVWIQGLVSIYYSHYNAGVPNRILYRFTIKEVLKRCNLQADKNSLYKRGIHEQKILKKVKHVVGRTSWDKACSKMINPNLNYHFCNETLRNVFYIHQWDIDKCERYSIFVSQSKYPIKGFHYVIKAAGMLKRRYPDIKVYSTGRDILRMKGKEALRLSSYEKYMIELIKENELQNNICYLGSLYEDDMCKQYLRAHVFVSASSVENSPNSLGEAMILGVPTVASDVGGVSDMMLHKKEGFIYPADAPYMLSYYIEEIFGNDDVAKDFSKAARRHATVTHDKEKNLREILNIFNVVIENVKR